MLEDKIKSIENMCIDVGAHSRLDYEITLSGNGVTPSECLSMAWAILDILHGDGRKWMDNNDDRVQARVQELKDWYGD